jgi:hypothetical protein
MHTGVCALVLSTRSLLFFLLVADAMSAPLTSMPQPLAAPDTPGDEPTAASEAAHPAKRRDARDRKPRSLLPLCNLVKQQRATAAQEACAALAEGLAARSVTARTPDTTDLLLFGSERDVLAALAAESEGFILCLILKT